MLADLPDKLEGRKVKWSSIDAQHVGLVVADFRGQVGEDILTRERSVSNRLMVQDVRSGRRQTISDHWIDEVIGDV